MTESLIFYAHRHLSQLDFSLRRTRIITSLPRESQLIYLVYGGQNLSLVCKLVKSGGSSAVRLYESRLSFLLQSYMIVCCNRLHCIGTTDASFSLQETDHSLSANRVKLLILCRFQLFQIIAIRVTLHSVLKIGGEFAT